MSQLTNLKERVRKILIEEAAPALGLDASALEVVDIDGGVAKVRLGRICSGDPGTLMMVIRGIEKELRKRFPEITWIDALP
jgi:Fe-S cluster biogenesis protein NfuA